jgi:protein SCO1/2
VFILVFSGPLLAGEASNVGQDINRPAYTRTMANYKVPDVAMIRQDGKLLSSLHELDDGRPVILSFVFVSCSAICPMLSHVLSKVQSKLTKDNQSVHLVSISIDPENDTPTQLIEYSKKFGAGDGWDFYTGSRKNSHVLQKAFNAYRGDKMNHQSVILMREKPSNSWVRLEGFMSPDDIINEFKTMLQQSVFE